MMVVEETEENSDDIKVQVSENMETKDIEEKIGNNGNHENNSSTIQAPQDIEEKIGNNGNHENNSSTIQTPQDFEISGKFLQNVFKYDEETEDKVWRNESSDLPAVVQVIRISKERNESQAFSVCDGNGYLWNSCFISRDKEVPMNSIVKIISMENVKNEDYDKYDFLTDDSIFDDVLAIAEFEIVHPGDEVGHCLWNLKTCKQFYVLSSGNLDDKEDQLDILNKKDLWDLTSVPEKCDVRFEFSDEQVIHAHKHVLKEKSSVFEAHFDGEGVFADQELVKITDSNFRIFKKFLKWVYGFNVQFESLEAIFELIYLCDKYILEEFLVILRDKVEESLKFAPQNAVAVSNLNKTNDVQIQKIIFEVIDKNIQLLCHSGEFKKWDLDSMVLISARDSLNIDEWQLLQYVFCWGEEYVETQEQFVELLKNIKFEEIHKSMLKNFLETEKMKSAVQKGILSLSVLESMISLRLFKNTSALEKRILYSRDLTNFSSYRSTEHFSSDPKDISILSPVIFPIQLTPDTLTSLPMVLLNDSFTLIQPNINLKSLKSGKFSLECLIRLNGAVSGLPDLSVFRQADYFRHVSDIQATVELYHVTVRGWSKQVLDLSQGGVMVFRGIDVKMVQDVLTGRHVFRGCLVVRQFRGQDDRFNSSELTKCEFDEDGSESEPEGEDLGHDDDEEEEESDEEAEDLDDFIEDEAEVSGEEEEALVDNDDSGDEVEGEEGSDDEKSSNVGNKENNFGDSGRSESEDNADLNAEEEEDKEGEEAEFSSDEEVVVKRPRHKHQKRKKHGEHSSDEEMPRKKKRKRVVLDSESESEDETEDVSVRKRKENLNSDEGESEYETDSEMGDEIPDQTNINEARTPETQFSAEEDDPVDTQFSAEEDDPVDAQFSAEDDPVDSQFSAEEDDSIDAQLSADEDVPVVEAQSSKDDSDIQNTKDTVKSLNGSSEVTSSENITKTQDVGSSVNTENVTVEGKGNDSVCVDEKSEDVKVRDVESTDI